MTADDPSSTTYAVRRQARGAEPALASGAWKRRLIAGGSALTAALLALGGLAVYRSVTYVGTIRAEVQAVTVALSPDFDAPVAEVMTAEWTKVARDQELVRFDDSARRAELAAAEAGVMLKQSRYGSAETDVTAAQAALATARVRFKEETRRAGAERGGAEARLNHLKNGTRPEEIEAARARLDSARAIAALNTLELKQSQQLFERGIESGANLEIRKTKLITQNNAVREAELELAGLQAGPRAEEIEQALQALNARDADLALARAAEQDLARLEHDLAGREAGLRQAQAELDQARADVAIRRGALERTVLRSPVDGTVTRIYFNRGEVVRKGEITVELTDDAGGRWVEGFVLEKDGDRIVPGQKARVEIGVDSGHYVDAVVDCIGSAKGHVEGSRVRAFTETGTYGRPAPVWVKFTLAGMDTIPRPGTSAQVRITVRN
ncbi:MAG: HlyD family efflux transporter periplasmic adaptor subunit [Planctomycetota bacterium]